MTGIPRLAAQPITEVQLVALKTLSWGEVDPTEAGLHRSTVAALRRRGWAERTGRWNNHRITEAGREALAAENAD